MAKLPKLPKLLDRKIYKSGQTRGADDDEVYQNRVGRTSTVLIPLQFWNNDTKDKVDKNFFEAGYIVLLKPEDYFAHSDEEDYFKELGLKLGVNALLFYETRLQWNAYNPERKGLKPASSRVDPLGGEYIARVPATTSLEGGSKINRGFTLTSLKGAGIRQYEYANMETVKSCRLQLETIYWLCKDSIEAATHFGMTKDEALLRHDTILEEANNNGLLDYDKLRKSRIVNDNNVTVCPLCLEEISAYGFYNRLAQAEGREVPDLTVTEINLFHIEELKYGSYNHRPYNLGWGHHHCNVVVKDSGILPTLRWMKRVIVRNEESGTDITI